MRRVIKFVLVFALLGGALYGAAKGYSYYRVKQTLDEVAFRAEPWGDFSYGPIKTELSGQVVIDDLVFQQTGSPLPVSVERLRIAGPGILFFVDPRNQWHKGAGKPPPRLNMSAEGVHMPSLRPYGSESGLNTEGLFYSTCEGGADTPSLMTLYFGGTGAEFDSEFGWDFDRVNERLSVTGGSNIGGVQSTAFAMDLSGITALDPQRLGSPPQLQSADLQFFVDPEYGQRLVAACSEKLGVSPAAFTLGLYEEQKQVLEQQIGFQPGAGLQFALQSFYANWGKLHLRAEPDQPVGVMSLAFLSRARLMNTLNLNLRVNNTEVPDLSFDWNPPQGGFDTLGEMVGKEPPPARKAPPRRIRYEQYWSPVDIAGLSSNMRRVVRLYSAGQPPREGVLLSIEDGRAEVQQRLHGGQFSAFIPTNEITKAEVQRRREIK